MELPSNILEQFAFNTRPKPEEQMLIVWKNLLMQKIYLNCYKLCKNNLKLLSLSSLGIMVSLLSRVRNNKFYFLNSITDKNGFNQ